VLRRAAGPFPHLRAVAASLALLACPALAQAPAASASPPGLHVQGNRILDDSGAPLRIAGVNRSGSEYECIRGASVFAGPTRDAAIAAIASWGVNAVRVPLNEDCWLGINGVNPLFAGSLYRQAVSAFLTRLQAHGLDVILDLHWGAPGGDRSAGQEQAPDADHAVDFWSSVASRFKGVPGIAFDLFNEPHDISWSCWLHGCTTPAGWRATGMQQLLDAVRAAGATQPVIAQGLGWGGDLSQWLAYRPHDPAGQLVAGWHIYEYYDCATVDCWERTVAPVAREVPVLATEVGETDCSGRFLDALLPWADVHAIGYLAWAWNPLGCGGNGPSLIADYRGTPTPYGSAFRAHINPAVGTYQPVDPRARFDFEDGTTDGWGTSSWPGSLGATVVASNETGTAWSGAHGLALDVSGLGLPVVGVSSGLAGARAGTLVTCRVWAPPGVRAGLAPVLLAGQDLGGLSPLLGSPSSALPAQQLTAGWNTVSFAVPAGLSTLGALGLRVGNLQGWSGRLVLDDVSW
jgi:endoglucanase